MILTSTSLTLATSTTTACRRKSGRVIRVGARGAFSSCFIFVARWVDADGTTRCSIVWIGAALARNRTAHSKPTGVALYEVALATMPSRV
jgi:hypothetical protein